MLILKRKIKQLILFLIGIIVLSLTVRAVVQSQLNKEIQFYKRYYEQYKDSTNTYNPLAIKQIPEEVIDEFYNTRVEDATKNEKFSIDWSKYAYVSYATHSDYLCNSLMLFNSLIEYGTKAKLVLLLSNDLESPEDHTLFKFVNDILDRLREIGGDQIIIKHVANIEKTKDHTEWNYSLSKLRVFNQTEFERVIYLDNDAILRDKLDELFFIPDYIKFAAPLSYWNLNGGDLEAAYTKVTNDKLPINLARYNDKIISRIKTHKMIYNHLPSLPANLFLDTKNIAQDIIRSEFSFSSLMDHHLMSRPNKLGFASNLMVIKPSKETFELIQDSLLPKYLKRKDKYDMDLINEELYNLKKLIRKQFFYFRRIKTQFVPEVLVLPFGRYDVLTGSLTTQSAHRMLKNDVLGYKRLDKKGEEFPKDIVQIYKDAKYVHFSDYPQQKPWFISDFDSVACQGTHLKFNDADEAELACRTWNTAYITYLKDRRICFADASE